LASIAPPKVETPITFKSLNVVVPPVLIPGILKFVNPDPLPTNEVAVRTPLTFTSSSSV
jgi:hypothetical protein